ncbi:MAG: amidohydrolase family protein [Ignavibacteriaceae bacterium]
MQKLILLILPLLFIKTLLPQADTVMYFEDYDPPSSLVVPQHPLRSAKYPFIDVHNHQWNMSKENLAEVITEMDKLNMAVMVNLSGRGFTRVETEPGKFEYRMKDSQYLKESIKNVSEQNPGRFIIFTNVDFHNFGEEGWTERILKELEDDVKSGANGLKIYKNLGLTLKDNNGNRVPTDDTRLDPIWQKCAELGIPVLIHTGEPFQFWQPQDKNNERWLELKQKPNRYRDPKKYPPWEQVMEEQHNVFRKHPNTIFINAHLGWLGNDLDRLGTLMDEIPNMYTEIGAVLAELGRQPRFAREWFIKYQDRIMFGKDSWNPEEYYVYFRVLETNDEYFDYYRKRHAFWKMYGLGLTDEVLKKLYYKNALKIIPGIDNSLFPD